MRPEKNENRVSGVAVSKISNVHLGEILELQQMGVSIEIILDPSGTARHAEAEFLTGGLIIQAVRVDCVTILLVVTGRGVFEIWIWHIEHPFAEISYAGAGRGAGCYFVRRGHGASGISRMPMGDASRWQPIM